MNIVLFSQYFPPEVGATQMRAETFARHLALSGHRVTVIAEVPNHPIGRVFPGWERTLVRRTSEHGYQVIRVWVATSPRKSFWRRLAFYGTYALHAFLVALLLVRRRPDVVLATSPPLSVAIAGRAVAALWRRPFVADIRDIWPAVGIALGELPEGRAAVLAQRVEQFLYRRSAAVTTVTRTFVDHVVSLGPPPERVHLIPNGTVPEVFDPNRTDPTIRSTLGLEGKYVVGYLGLHGIAQGLPALVEAAANLEAEDVAFLFVGEGPVKADLRELAEGLHARNVQFCDQVPTADVAPWINACDAVVVPLRRLEILAGFVPSKLFDFMSCARPVLLMVDGEARQILEEADAGLFVEPEDSEALAAAVRRLCSDPEAAAAMGAAGRAYILKHYVRARQATALQSVLESVTNH